MTFIFSPVVIDGGPCGLLVIGILHQQVFVIPSQISIPCQHIVFLCFQSWGDEISSCITHWSLRHMCRIVDSIDSSYFPTIIGPPVWNDTRLKIFRPKLRVFHVCRHCDGGNVTFVRCQGYSRSMFSENLSIIQIGYCHLLRFAGSYGDI